jgi:ABC-2 type transport system permease protein
MSIFNKHKQALSKQPLSNNNFILKFLLEKEFIQFSRNKFFPKMLIAVPLISLALFPMVANFDVKNIRLVVVDNDQSNYSTRLMNKATASGHFTMKGIAENYDAALYYIEQDKADLILEIPVRFEESLITQGKTQVLIAANSVNGMKGGLSSSYMATIISNFTAELLSEKMPASNSLKAPMIEIVPHYRFNPHLEYKYTMIPGILMMILAMIVGFLPALNIVGEKEKGTLEQMNVTPASPFIIILSKLIPYWLMGFVVLTIGFLLPGFFME